MYFNLNSTAFPGALNNGGVKTCFNCSIFNIKLIQHPFIKYFVFHLG